MSIQTGTRLGRYEIRSKIGAGGMGEVYLAQDTKLDRKVALKILPAEIAADRGRMNRFVQEAKAASGLNHPNIITIYEIDETDSGHFIATEFIDGETLRQHIRSTPLKLGEVLDVAAQIASALAAAHAAAIVHRDIKPENVMIRHDGIVKVLDFGLAKLTERVPPDSVDTEAPTSFKTDPGTIVGTPIYMSPEQARGLQVDARTDIFSLAVLIYEMVAGRLPFEGSNTNEIVASILSDREMTPLARYAREVPAELEWIVEKALTKNRDERYQSVKDLLIDLQRLKHSLTVQATIDRSASPEAIANTRNETVAARSSAVNTSAAEAGAARLNVGHPTSSAEYIVNQVKNHKRGVIVTLALLVLTIATAALVYRWRLKETAAPSQPVIKSLAVLPLKSLDEGENYLGLGIADAVIRRMSQTGELIVRPTSAVRRYLNEETDGLTAAKQLGVDSVLEGTVQRANDRLRVSVNLLRASDGTSLWADSFDMRAGDIFTIQDSISQQVAIRLQLKLNAEQQARLGKRYTSNPEAYEYYVKGRAYLERRTIAMGDRELVEAAIRSFKRAVELDPKYALAHAALGQAYMWMANFTEPDNPIWAGLAQQALSQAESLDPQMAEIHAVRFEYYFSKYGGWDLAQAAREARHALALNPSVGHQELGTIYDHLGLDEVTGLREMQRALEIDPTNNNIQVRLAETYELYGKFDDAIETYHRFVGTSGPTFSLIGKGRLDEAQSLLEERVKKNSGDLRGRSELALLLALKGNFQEAEAAIPAILEQARNNRAYHHMTYNIACVHALAGKTDEAVKWLRTTTETGMPNYPLFARDSHLERIRKESAFIQFMTELKKRWDGYKQEFEKPAADD